MSELQDSEFKEKQREHGRNSYWKHHEKNLERVREYNAARRTANRDEYNRKMREYNAKNRERINSRRRERLATDPVHAEKVRTRDRSRPKDQVKNTRIRNDYGITLEEFNAMRLRQNYRCAICGVHEDEAGVKKLAIDHCHTEKHVRGLLCSHCNTGLGQFKDNVDLLLKAISYLER